jgi:hypothetical protein
VMLFLVPKLGFFLIGGFGQDVCDLRVFVVGDADVAAVVAAVGAVVGHC